MFRRQRRFASLKRFANAQSNKNRRERFAVEFLISNIHEDSFPLSDTESCVLFSFCEREQNTIDKSRECLGEKAARSLAHATACNGCVYDVRLCLHCAFDVRRICRVVLVGPFCLIDYAIQITPRFSRVLSGRLRGAQFHL